MSRHGISAILLGIFIAPLVLAAKLPADVTKCNYEGSDCIVQTTNYILSRHFNGIPESNLNAIDPILVEKVNIIQGPESPVNVNLQFRNLNIQGLKDARVESVKGFKKEANGVVNEIRAIIPRLELVGEYTVNGKVLILPIQGEGKSNITMTNVRAVIRAKGKTIESKGSIYFQADQVRTHVDPDRVYMLLENLYRGDKRLGDSTNLFLNENWQDIFKELRPAVEDTFAEVLKGVINGFFAKNKYHTLFIE